jgi:hypothetical protein
MARLRRDAQEVYPWANDLGLLLIVTAPLKNQHLAEQYGRVVSANSALCQLRLRDLTRPPRYSDCSRTEIVPWPKLGWKPEMS